MILVLDSEIVECCLVLILCCETGVGKIAVDVTPLSQATVIEHLHFVCDDERNDTTAQALLKHNKTANTSITILERIFDDMNNGFGWARPPKSFMAENTVFLLLTAIIRNFYKFLMGRLDTKAFGLKKCSRIKAFVFKFISVPAKWIRTARHYELNIYTHNHSYRNPFALDDG